MSPVVRGRQKFCLVLEARFPLGLSTALQTSTRVESAGHIGAGKKVQCKEKGKGALIYFLRQMRQFFSLRVTVLSCCIFHASLQVFVII